MRIYVHWSMNSLEINILWSSPFLLQTVSGEKAQSSNNVTTGNHFTYCSNGSSCHNVSSHSGGTAQPAWWRKIWIILLINIKAYIKQIFEHISYCKWLATLYTRPVFIKNLSTVEHKMHCLKKYFKLNTIPQISRWFHLKQTVCKQFSVFKIVHINVRVAAIYDFAFVSIWIRGYFEKAFLVQC
jgi:hypothetical protein